MSQLIEDLLPFHKWVSGLTLMLLVLLFLLLMLLMGGIKSISFVAILFSGLFVLALRAFANITFVVIQNMNPLQQTNSLLI